MPINRCYCSYSSLNSIFPNPFSTIQLAPLFFIQTCEKLKHFSRLHVLSITPAYSLCKWVSPPSSTLPNSYHPPIFYASCPRSQQLADRPTSRFAPKPGSVQAPDTVLSISISSALSTNRISSWVVGITSRCCTSLGARRRKTILGN